MPHTLLLADDSVTIQRVIELTFADEDIRVVAVSDGDQAIAVIERTPPDIVLADVGMPGRSGYEVAQYIKQTPHLAHIPVVLLTGAFEPIDQGKADAAGCDGVLAKPFEPQLVIGRVKELLGRPKQTPPPPEAAVEPPPAPSWTPPPSPSWTPTVSEPAQPPVERSTEDYFEHLDQAFASLSGPGQAESPLSSASAPTANAIDWFGQRPASTEAPAVSDTWDVPAQSAELPLGRPAFPAAPSVSNPFTWTPPAPSTLPPVVAAPVVLPPLADAFAALLAAEQGAPSPVSAPAWPGSSQPTAVSDDLVEQITLRVLDRLSDRIVRETVVEIVTGIAERLVREEIERIKAAIK